MMRTSQQLLLDLLQGQEPDFGTCREREPSYLSAKELASVYVLSAMFATAMEFLSEQLWLKNREDTEFGRKTTYRDFIVPFLEKELIGVFFFKEFLIASGPNQHSAMQKRTSVVSSKVLSFIMERSYDEQKCFLIQSLREMSTHFLYEEKLQEDREQSLGHLGPCLYSTFDELDLLLGLDYVLDKEMKKESFPKERLYQGAGVKVQSGYSTILLALHHLKLTSGTKMIDLGSGYGRVGLVCALLYPDVNFIGYEYVSHRVDVSNRAARLLGLEKSLLFVTQDLSLASFQIPDAQVYYLYDPFTHETYRYILEQIVEVSQSEKVMIVTKGNARSWLVDIAKANHWLEPLLIDEGNLALFESM